VVYGGSAGGGKSYALLLDPLRYLTRVPGFSGVIFRRTYPEIAVPGGLWDTATEIYARIPGARAKVGELTWEFAPFGNTIQFRHLQHEQNKYQWQGSQVTYFGFDELTHFTESQFIYVGLSRGRSGCEVESYIRATCNPDPGWVKSFLAPWVDKEYPAPARSGQTRWFIREDGVIKWVDRCHPDAKSLSFIRATVYDNPIMLARNPRYIASLKAQLPVERARLLDGDWDVRREGLVYPEFESCVVDGPAAPALPDVGAIDFGFSCPFACVWGHVDHDGILWITGMRYVRQCTIPTHAESIPKGVRYWCDPALPESIKELRNNGHDCIPCIHLRSRGSQGEMKKPILHGIDLVTSRIRSGRLKVVRSACLPLVREAGMYCYDPEKRSENPVDADNHAMDALRYLVVGLDRGKAAPAPEFVGPDQPPAPRPDPWDDERMWN
jgi:hypothetical protein